MPNNEERKYTVDDILDEYDKAFHMSEQAETVSPDETISVYKETELFDSDSDSTGEAGYAVYEKNSVADDECSEEITETEFEDNVEITEEILEIDRSEAENADVVINEDKTIEETIVEEVMLWKNNIDSDAIAVDYEQKKTEENQPESEKEVQSEVVSELPAEPETIKETATEPQSEPEEEDINDKFLKKVFRGLIPWKGDNAGEITRKVIFLIAMIVFIGAGVMLVSTLFQSRKALEDKEKNQSIITTTVATTIDSDGNVVTIAPTEEEIAEHNFNVAEHFKSINEDYVGYLEVEGCDIYEPIMQGDDNYYYLDHNYYGGTNKAGTVFLDYRCTVSEEYTSPNIVFYGHNQEDGTMFGNLKDYKQDIEFYRENPLIRFSSEFETYEYIIYGYFITHVRPEQHSSGEVFHYHDYIESLSNEETFNWYINEIMERNQIVSPVDVQYGDQLICLSTCSNEFSDSRFVVFARRLREGETIDAFDLSAAYLNPYAKGVDWEAIMSNETSLTDEESETEESLEESQEEETSETEAPEETTAKDTRRNYRDVMHGKYTTTKVTETETETEAETYEGEGEETDDSSSETTAPDGEENVTETASLSDITDETTEPPESSAE